MDVPTSHEHSINDRLEWEGLSHEREKKVLKKRDTKRKNNKKTIIIKKNIYCINGSENVWQLGPVYSNIMVIQIQFASNHNFHSSFSH